MFKRVLLGLILVVLALVFLTGCGCGDCEKGTLSVEVQKDVPYTAEWGFATEISTRIWSFEESGVTLVTTVALYEEHVSWVRVIRCADGSTTDWWSWGPWHTEDSFYANTAVRSVTLHHKEDGDWMSWEEEDGSREGQSAVCSDLPFEAGVLVVDEEYEKVWLFEKSEVRMLIDIEERESGGVVYRRKIVCPDGSEHIDVRGGMPRSMDHYESEFDISEASYLNGMVSYIRTDGLRGRTHRACPTIE